MGRKAPKFRRFIKSPTFTTIARPLFALPIAVAACAILLVGSTHVLSRGSSQQQAPYTAEQKIKTSPEPLAKTPSSVPSTTSPNTNTDNKTAPPSTNSSGHVPRQSSNKQSAANPGGALSNPACASIIKSLTDTYNQQMSDAENLLEHHLVTSVLDLNLQNQYIDDYNISITGAYNQAEAGAQKQGCNLTLPMPSLEGHHDG